MDLPINHPTVFNILPRQKKKFRFHVLGLVHLPVSEEYMGCAFTQKIYKTCKMLLDLGHEVYLYGAEGSNAPCTEFIQTHTLNDIREEWGDGDNRFDIGYDWRGGQFRHDINDKVSKVREKALVNMITEINKRKKSDDFILNPQGYYFKPVIDAVDLFLSLEPGIGYRGSYGKLKSGKANWRAFESAYIQNFTYGSEHPRQAINGSYYDRVIPNYFDAKDFPYVEKKEDYYFFIGRLIHRKGVETAVKATEALGKKLIVAGQPDANEKPNINKDHVEYIGYVDPEERSKLMGGAIATFAPTTYLEPFAGVHVESMLCGTPVITTNFGVFPGTVVQGETGFRCDTLDDFVRAAELSEGLNTGHIRKYAERYLMDNVMWEYEKWFRDLYQVYLSAHDSKIKGWNYIDGISKSIK